LTSDSGPGLHGFGFRHFAQRIVRCQKSQFKRTDDMIPYLEFLPSSYTCSTGSYTSLLDPSPLEHLGRILRVFHPSLNAGKGHVNSRIVMKASPLKKKSRFPHSVGGLAADGCSILLAYQDGFALIHHAHNAERSDTLKWSVDSVCSN
jgi:hypothetical protein